MIKVLVVDDSALVRKLFGRVLENETDFEVQFARNGVEALHQLEEFRPSVITLDVHMPQMGGLECLDRIHGRASLPGGHGLHANSPKAPTPRWKRCVSAQSISCQSPRAPCRCAWTSSRRRWFLKSARPPRRGSGTARGLRERVVHRTRGKQPPPVARARRRSGRAYGEGIVLVGTSTGGPSALEALLTRLPEGFPWPILVAQHMPATFTGALAKRLDDLCAVQVVEVLSPTILQPRLCVHRARRCGSHRCSKNRGVSLLSTAPAERDYPWHPSTDRLVRSAMTHLPAEQLIGVLMTGMGNDGAAAMTTLRAQGGRTIAGIGGKRPSSGGMPGELARAGGADWIEPLHKIADRLIRIAPPHATHS